MTICGLDEAGRGALAGPLVAAAIVCSPHIVSGSLKIKDSKLLTAKERNKIYRWIIKNKISFTTEIISTRQINNRGIGWANKEIFKRLIKKIDARKYFVDGNLKIKVKDKGDRVKSVVDADATILPCILAGIVAKVTRDKMMTDLGQLKKFRKYQWKINKGYGTKTHIMMLKDHGATRYHRSVFVTTALKVKTENP